jgi:molybdopterin-guanine dinucleotide biosynthesis protein A
MGGRDKGLVPVAGRAMVQWVAGAMARQCEAVMVNANRNAGEYARLTGCPVVADREADFAGPLAGMAAGLAASDAPLLACVPCDSPLVAPDLVARLRAALDDGGAELAVAHDGERMQPVFALLRRELRDSMERFLAAGGRKIDAWYAQHRVALAPFPDASDMFLNVNTPEQRDALEQRLQAAGGDPAGTAR